MEEMKTIKLTLRIEVVIVVLMFEIAVYPFALKI